MMRKQEKLLSFPSVWTLFISHSFLRILLDIIKKSGYNYNHGLIIPILFMCIVALEAEVRYRRNVYHALTMITQFGINMLVPIFLCSFIGIYIDRKCGTSFWMVLLFFVGAFAGFRNVYIFAKKVYSMKSEKDTALERERKKQGHSLWKK